MVCLDQRLVTAILTAVHLRVYLDRESRKLVQNNLTPLPPLL